jgi:C-terminal processing protease CtpA/Prc
MMKMTRIIKRVSLVIVQCTVCLLLFGQQYSPEKLNEDVEILEKTLKTLHPGLYRYNDTIQIENRLSMLRKSFSQPKSLQEVYLEFSKFLESIKCGHTFANYWNQPAHIQKALFQKADKLPLTFKIVDKRLIIEKNLGQSEIIREGSEVLSINQQPVEELLADILQYISTDGSNDNKKWAELHLTGQGDYEVMDIFLPLLSKPIEGKYHLEIFDLNSGKTFVVEVTAISRAERKHQLSTRFNEDKITYDSLWKFEILEGKIGYMKIGTFVTYKMSLNWKKFLADAFMQMKKESIKHFILDIRGNGGGMDQVSVELSKYLVKKPITLPSAQYYVAAEKTPAYLRPYLSTWDKGFYNWGNRVKRTNDGHYVFREKEKVSQWRPTNKMYQGKTYLLIDGANSSATFYLARNLKTAKDITLVGQGTGGNLKGMNAGAILFLSLPNTKIEVDIPLIATVYDGYQDDAGLQPDMIIKPIISDVISGKDTVLEVLKESILCNDLPNKHMHK